MDQLAAIESALDTVKQTLDALVERGHEEQAFEIARAQFRASIRASWPTNLGPLIQIIDGVLNDPGIKLTATERDDLTIAVSVLRDTLQS